MAAGSVQSDTLERTLREVCESLAPIERTPCSPGEREAAEWVAARLRTAGVAEVALEEEPSWGGAPPTLVTLGALGIAGAALVLARRDCRRCQLSPCQDTPQWPTVRDGD